MQKKDGRNELLKLVQDGQPMTLGQQLKLTVQLSIPAIISQISSILMQFIDASMVGSLGAEASASIGLVSTTTWLFAGISVACATGFYVQVSHLLGSKDTVKARSVLRQSIVMVMIFSLAVSAIGCAVSGPLPRWLGGEADIHRDASMYFLIFMLSLPALQLNMLASGMLRSSGNMYTPSLLNILMCLLDVVFNFFLIFPSRTVEFGYTLKADAFFLANITGSTGHFFWTDIRNIALEPGKYYHILLIVDGGRQTFSVNGIKRTIPFSGTMRPTPLEWQIGSAYDPMTISLIRFGGE